MTEVSRLIRVAIADGSPFAGELLRGWLTTAGFTVVGVARDGRTAVDLVRAVRPDVLAVGLRLAGIDGIGVIEEVMSSAPTPVVLVCGAGRGATVAARRAVELGAVDVLYKRAGPAGPFPNVLAARLKQAAGIKVIRSLPGAPEPKRLPPRGELIVVGASTGGPAAVLEFLVEMPVAYSASLVVVQHLPGAFAAAFASQLARRIPHAVQLARAGDIAPPGVVTVAPADSHLEFGASGVQLTGGPRVHGFRPAIDVTMQSAAQQAGPNAIGVLLTGMGRDGVAGLSTIRSAGGRTFAQSPETCVVDGMPRAAIAAGCVQEVDRPGRLARRIVRLLSAKVRE